MRIKVRYFTTLRELSGCAEEELEIEEGATLANIITVITSKYGKKAHDYLYSRGENSKIDPSIYFLINGMNSKIFSGINAKLKDGDIVAIIPPIGGG